MSARSCFPPFIHSFLGFNPQHCISAQVIQSRMEVVPLVTVSLLSPPSRPSRLRTRNLDGRSVIVEIAKRAEETMSPTEEDRREIHRETGSQVYPWRSHRRWTRPKPLLLQKERRIQHRIALRCPPPFEPLPSSPSILWVVLHSRVTTLVTTV